MPATFRAAVAGQRFPGVIVFPSFKFPALEGSGIDRFEEMSERVEGLDQFSEEYENLSSVFADAQQLTFDPEGRITLPPALAQHASITEQAAFVGQGRSFQIWQPRRFEEHQAALRDRARRQGARLPPLAPAGRRPE